MNVKTIDITAVTTSQIDRCSRVIDENTMTPFYLVLSESDNLTEYKVSAIRKNGEYFLICTCPAGLRGIPCKHRRWAMAAAEEYKADLKAQAQRDAKRTAAQARRQQAMAALHISYSDVDTETLERMAERNQHPRPVAAVAPTRRAGFSLLK